MTLGMSKLKVSTILVLETVIVGVISLGIGLLLGIGLSQLLSIFTAKLFEADMTKFTFVFLVEHFYQRLLILDLFILL